MSCLYLLVGVFIKVISQVSRETVFLYEFIGAFKRTGDRTFLSSSETRQQSTATIDSNNRQQQSTLCMIPTSSFLSMNDLPSLFVGQKMSQSQTVCPLRALRHVVMLVIDRHNIITVKHYFFLILNLFCSVIFPMSTISYVDKVKVDNP